MGTDRALRLDRCGHSDERAARPGATRALRGSFARPGGLRYLWESDTIAPPEEEPYPLESE
jgi:hypothetical protein